MLRKLDLAEMDVAAQVHRTAFDEALPWLTGRHTPQEDRWFFRERLFKTSQLWGAFESAQMLGIIAFREDWVDQLYVLPSSQQRGIGTRLEPYRLPRRLFRLTQAAIGVGSSRSR